MNILWDLDGTIMDTYPTLVDTFIHTSGLELDKEEVLSLMKLSSEVAFKHYNIPLERYEEYIAYEKTLSHDKKPLFPFAKEVLQVADKNFLVTNRNAESTKDLLSFWGITDYFEEVICPGEFARKPETTSYAYLHEKYHIDLVIGDRELDFIPARKIGIKTCAFQNDEISADFHLHNYQDFPSVLLSMTFDTPYSASKAEVSKEMLHNYFDRGGNRLKHILEVARKSGNTPESILHDIGYSDELKITGFHPLDGALFCTNLGCGSEVLLPVMYHSGAMNEVRLSNSPFLTIYEKCKLFINETITEKIDWLSYCDMTTSSKGEDVTIDERMSDIFSRYDEMNIVHRNIKSLTSYFKLLEERYQ